MTEVAAAARRLAGVRHVVVAVTTLLAAAVPVAAQRAPLQFERIAQERGLSNGTVTAVVQANDGFLWIGTADGLNRYDGTGFTLFRPVVGDTTSLAHGWITALAPATTGLWVSTLRGGVHLFRHGGPGFERFSHRSADPQSLSSNEVNTVIESPDGAAWAGTVRGLDRIDAASRRVRRYVPPPGHPDSLTHDVLALAHDTGGRLWVGTRGALFRFDPSTGRFTAAEVELRTRVVRSLLRDKRGTLWIGTEDELVALDPVTGAVRARHRAGGADAPFTGRVLTLHEGPDGTIWIGSDDGLSALDPVRRSFIRHRNAPREPRSLGGRVVRSILVDAGGVLWAGHESYGLSKHAPSVVHFDLLRHDPARSPSLSDDYIRGMTLDREGILWIGTQYGGLNRYDAGTGLVAAYRHEPGNPRSLPADEVWAVHEDRAGRMWVGLHRNGLGTFDRRTGAFRRFTHIPATVSVNVIAEDRAGALLVGLDGRGLYEISPDRRSVRSYGAPHGTARAADQRVLVHDDVQAVLEDRAGMLWVGGAGGLTRVDRRAGRAVSTPEVPAGLFITNIVEDSRGIIWIGTKGAGLLRHDPASGRVTTIGVAEGLPHSFVYGILEDARGTLWLSTDDGIANYDPQSGRMTPYGLSDGLQAREFNRRAFYRAADGAMYMGGINGVNIFHPDRVTAVAPLPPVTLVSMKAGDAPPLIMVRATPGTAVRLSHDQGELTFTFAALEYSAPEKIAMQYRLEGIDRRWIDAGTRRYVSYAAVPPGRYTFLVRAANSAGEWNPATAGVTIEIAPPWTGTWWARALGVLMLVGIPVAGVRLGLRASRWRAAALEQRVQEQTHDLRIAQQQLHAALEREREAARELLEIAGAVPGAVFQLRTDANGDTALTFVSEGIARLGGAGPRDAAAPQDPIRLAERLLDRTCPTGVAGLGAVLEDARHADDSSRAEWQWTDDQGGAQWLGVQARASPHADGSVAWTGVMMDTTAVRQAEAERAALEVKMQQAQKAESLGVLAGGIAHDFNNLLVGILAGADLLQDDVSLTGDAAETLGHIRTAGLRGAELTKQMLAYAGKGRFIIGPVDLAALVREMLALLRSAIPRTVTLDFDDGGARGIVEADATQLRQVVMNLVTNASEAIGETGGHVSVRVAVEAAPRDALSLMHASHDMPAAGPYVALHVTDDGAGMDAATLEKIFDPFYTTKFTGRGLGLAALLGIVRAHRGGLHVTTQPGNGTTFSLYLPPSSSPVVAAGPGVPAVTWRPARPTGKVLVVDDDAAVREPLKAMLVRLGYDVISAVDGADALDALDALEQSGDIAVVLMDVTMPVMDGPAAVRALRARGCMTPVVLMSGYTEHELAARGAMADADGFMMKPFTAADLVRVIEAAVGAGVAGVARS